MRDNISITVPMEYTALNRAAEFFKGLSQDVLHTLPEKSPRLEEGTPVEVSESHWSKLVDDVSCGTDVPLEMLTGDGVDESPEDPTSLDVNGIPWDERIHASTQTKTVDGAWKNRRGVDKGLLATVEAELKGSVPSPEAVFTPAPATVAPVVAEPTVIPTTPPAPVAPSAPSGISTFPELMKAITSKEIRPEVVLNAVQSVGLQSLPLLAARTELIPQVATALGL